MLKIICDYSDEGAYCLLDILNSGIRSACAYCEYKGDRECPYDDIQKAKENIVDYIRDYNKKEEHK